MNYRLSIKIIMMAVALTPAALFADSGDPPFVTDTYEISFGPQWGVIPGDPAFLLPINVSFSQPTVRISLILTYDQTLLTPTLLAPNVFAQSFTYDLSAPGKIRMTMITDLPPPPNVPPIQGDTTVAWISFRITSRFIGWDYLTYIDYFEDPGTPLTDNFIVLENNTRIGPPVLLLDRANILIRLPLYGDINLNTYPWEIADAVAFMNFFMGAPFNRQQYANADCNRDGVQASISDLVYLLSAISYDTIAAYRTGNIFADTRGAYETSSGGNLLLSEEGRCDIFVESEVGIGGVALELNIGGGAESIEEIFLYPDASGMDLAYTVSGNTLKIVVIDWDRQGNSFDEGRMLGIRYAGETPPTIITTDFSDSHGTTIEATASVNMTGLDDNNTPSVSGLSLLGYPNPFNGEAIIRMSLPSDGQYQLAIYDVLGRRVRNLINDYRVAGYNDIIWDGADDFGAGVSSGTYFVRLKGDSGFSTIKLHLMK